MLFTKGKNIERELDTINSLNNTTMPLYKNHRVFISSPGDEKNERKDAERIINNVSRILRETVYVCLDVIMWKKFAPGSLEWSIQRRIYEKVAISGLLV